MIKSWSRKNYKSYSCQLIQKPSLLSSFMDQNMRFPFSIEAYEITVALYFLNVTCKNAFFFKFHASYSFVGTVTFYIHYN